MTDAEKPEVEKVVLPEGEGTIREVPESDGEAFTPDGDEETPEPAPIKLTRDERLWSRTLRPLKSQGELHAAAKTLAGMQQETRALIATQEIVDHIGPKRRVTMLLGINDADVEQIEFTLARAATGETRALTNLLDFLAEALQPDNPGAMASLAQFPGLVGPVQSLHETCSIEQLAVVEALFGRIEEFIRTRWTYDSNLGWRLKANGEETTGNETGEANTSGYSVAR